MKIVIASLIWAMAPFYVQIRRSKTASLSVGAPDNALLAEDGITPLVAEDGVTVLIQES
jgi:hypothetical protein